MMLYHLSKLVVYIDEIGLTVAPVHLADVDMISERQQ